MSLISLSLKAHLQFFIPLEMTIYQGSNTTQLISLEFILGHSCWLVEGPLGPTQFPLGFCPLWRGEADVRRCFLPMANIYIFQTCFSHDWLVTESFYNVPSRFLKELEGPENNYMPILGCQILPSGSQNWACLRITQKACYSFRYKR